MAERRSLANAMGMTPEKRAFIQGDGAKAATTKLTVSADAKSTKTIEIDRPVSEGDDPSDAKPRNSRRSGRSRAQQSAPGAGDILDQVLVPVTVRLPHRMAQALKRAYLEQRLRHMKPDTQQEIVEAAVGDWLAKKGLLD